jgi:predicted nicotinamide N-methyase
MKYRNYSLEFDKVQQDILNVEINGRFWKLCRPADLESMWEALDEEDLEAEKHLPYWVELWPAGILLARWLQLKAKEIKGKCCLDLGCGLGLSASAAEDCGANVVALDYEYQALLYAKYNSYLNGGAFPNWVQMDWTRPAFKKGSFAYIWGADIFYETRFLGPLVKLFEELLAPGGTIWIADPERSVSRQVWEKIAERGWKVLKAHEERVYFREYAMYVNLWEIKPAAVS